MSNELKQLRPRPLILASLILAVAGIPSVPGLAAQIVLSTGTPEEVGMSPSVLRAGVSLYEEAVERGDLVGAVLLVAKDGKIVLREAVGWRDQA